MDAQRRRFSLSSLLETKVSSRGFDVRLLILFLLACFVHIEAGKAEVSPRAYQYSR